MATQVSVEGVFDAVAVRVVLEAKKWQGESSESYTQRSEDLCYQVRDFETNIEHSTFE